MTPGMVKYEPTAGARRAAKKIERDSSFVESTATLIDQETGVRELVEVLEQILGEAGDLINGRCPELAARARAALRSSDDGAPRHAE